MFSSAVLVLAVVAVVAFGVWLIRRRRRERDRELSQQWDALQELWERTPGAELVEVIEVYQRARRGTKAIVRCLDTGREQDAWFQAKLPAPGDLMVVRASVGWGPHNRNPDVLYVEPSNILEYLPPETLQAVVRHERWQSKHAT